MLEIEACSNEDILSKESICLWEMGEGPQVKINLEFAPNFL